MVARSVRKSRWPKWVILILILMIAAVMAFKGFQRQIYIAIGYTEQTVCAGISDTDADALARSDRKRLGKLIDIHRDPAGAPSADTSVDVVFQDQNSDTAVVTARIFDDCSIDWHRDDPDI